MKCVLRITSISILVLFIFISTSYSGEYNDLILGKWIIYERTSKAFDHNSRFVKAPWYVSYEFNKDGKVTITVKKETDGPFPYRIKGNSLFIKKYDMEGEWGIVELTQDKLTLKSPGYINRYKREK